MRKLTRTRCPRNTEYTETEFRVFCGTPIVLVLSPTRFEMVMTNWRPARDLKVLIIGPAARQ